MWATCSVFLFSIGDVCTEEVLLCLSRNILFFSAQMPPILNKCPEKPVRVIESVIIISFELRFVDPAGLHAFPICPSLWVDSFIPWSCLCCGGVVVSHPGCCNNLDVRCSRQEGTGVAPVHQAPMPQKPLHNSAQLNSHVSLWQPDAFVRNCVTRSHLVDWFDASFELPVAFWLCSFFALFFTQDETRYSGNNELVPTPQEGEHTALCCRTPSLNLSICPAVSLFAFNMARVNC